MCGLRALSATGLCGAAARSRGTQDEVACIRRRAVPLVASLPRPAGSGRVVLLPPCRPSPAPPRREPCRADHGQPRSRLRLLKGARLWPGCLRTRSTATTRHCAPRSPVGRSTTCRRREDRHGDTKGGERSAIHLAVTRDPGVLVDRGDRGVDCRVEPHGEREVDDGAAAGGHDLGGVERGVRAEPDHPGHDKPAPSPRRSPGAAGHRQQLSEDLVRRRFEQRRHAGQAASADAIGLCAVSRGAIRRR